MWGLKLHLWRLKCRVLHLQNQANTTETNVQQTKDTKAPRCPHFSTKNKYNDECTMTHIMAEISSQRHGRGLPFPPASHHKFRLSWERILMTRVGGA